MPRLREFTYFLNQAWLQLIRDRVLAGTAILAKVATFFVSALFLLIAFNFASALDSIRDQREVQVFLDRGGAEDAWRKIGGELREIPGVADAHLVTPDDAIEEFERDFGESGLVDALGENPLPPTYRLSLGDDHREGDAIRRIASRAETVSGVESVRYGGPGIAKVESRVRTFARLNLIVGLLAGVSGVLIVSNTIKLTIIARKDLVEILTLIGATDGFVRRPFLLEGIMQSCAAAAGSLLVLRGIHALVSIRISGILYFSTRSIIRFLLFAVFLGWAGAYMACAGPLRGRWERSA